VIDSNLSRIIGYPRGFRGYPQLHQANTGIVSRLSHERLQPNNFYFVYVENYWWSSTAQSFLVLSPEGLMSIFNESRLWESRHLSEPIPSIILSFDIIWQTWLNCDSKTTCCIYLLPGRHILKYFVVETTYVCDSQNFLN
jgi:hypothetical protein